MSDTTVRDRRDEWIAAGVFDAIAAEAIGGYDRIIGLDLSDVAVDGCLHKAPAGGEGTGPNPTDRGKLGWKWSILTDRNGIPLGWTIDGANRNDSMLLAAHPRRRRRTRPARRDRHVVARPRLRQSASPAQRLAERDIDDAIIAKKRNTQRRARAPSTFRWGCAGRSSAPTRGCRTSVNSAETPTGEHLHRLAQFALAVAVLAHRKAHRLAKPLVTDHNTYPLEVLSLQLNLCGLVRRPS